MAGQGDVTTGIRDPGFGIRDPGVLGSGSGSGSGFPDPEIACSLSRRSRGEGGSPGFAGIHLGRCVIDDVMLVVKSRPGTPARRWCVMTTVALVVACAMVAPELAAQKPAAPSAQELLDAASDYARAAYPKLANLVATEEYVQERRLEEKAKRVLRSEFLLVQHPTEKQNWLAYRDVLEVDGKKLENHQDRLQKLFVAPTIENWMLVGDIANASQQYHLEGANVSVTNPFVVLALIDRYYRPRMQFKLGKEDKDVGTNVWTLVFQEPEAKTVVMVNGAQTLKTVEPLLQKDLARGTVWVDAGTGRILKTQLRMGDGLGAPTSMTTFRYDEKLKVAVPVEMKTTWTNGTGSRSAVNGTAKYTAFRQFGIQTTVETP